MNKTNSHETMTFKDYCLGTLFRPRQTFELLLTDGRRLKFGFYAILLKAFLYTLIYVFLTMAGGAPSTIDLNPGWPFPRMFIIFTTGFGWLPACLAAGSSRQVLPIC